MFLIILRYFILKLVKSADLWFMKTYIFEIRLFHKKSILRKIEIFGSASLYKFAGVIVGAYNFDFDHAFGFFSEISVNRYFDSERKYELFADMKDEGIEPTGAESVEKTKISDVWKNVGDKMLFLFDYGDNWLFTVELIGFGEKNNKIKYPKIVKKVGRAPKQYDL